MRCLRCSALDDKVIDSRTTQDGNAIRRRRECLQCGYRFTTYEQIERSELTVIKRGGRREQFSREKLKRGLLKACEKRPVTLDQIEDALEQVINELHATGDKEVVSSTIGSLVMNELGQIDQVAYIRYASVYRQFQDVDEFIQEIQTMQQRGFRSRKQPDLFQNSPNKTTRSKP